MDQEFCLCYKNKNKNKNTIHSNYCSCKKYININYQNMLDSPNLTYIYLWLTLPKFIHSENQQKIKENIINFRKQLNNIDIHTIKFKNYLPFKSSFVVPEIALLIQILKFGLVDKHKKKPKLMKNRHKFNFNL